MFSYILFSAGESERLKHLLADYSAFLLFIIKNKIWYANISGFPPSIVQIVHI